MRTFHLLLILGVVCFVIQNVSAEDADAQYKTMVQDVGNRILNLDAIGAANLNAYNPGFFLNIIITLHTSFGELLQIAKGQADSTVTSQCLSLNERVQLVLDQAQLHADDPINGSIASGEGLYQSLLEDYGKSLIRVQAAADAHLKDTCVTKYLGIILTMDDRIKSIRSIVKNRDNGPACIKATIDEGATLRLVLDSPKDYIATNSNTNCTVPSATG